MNVIESLKDKTAGFISSVGDVNKLLVSKVEESARLNLSSITYLTNTGLKQLRAFSDVHDMASTQKFAVDSMSLSGEVVKKVFEDARQNMNIWGNTTDKLSTILKGKGADAKPKTAAKPAE